MNQETITLAVFNAVLSHVDVYDPAFKIDTVIRDTKKVMDALFIKEAPDNWPL